MSELNRDCNILTEGSFEGAIGDNMKKLRDKGILIICVDADVNTDKFPDALL